MKENTTPTQEEKAAQALDKYFEPSETVTAQHELYNSFVAEYGHGIVNKFQMYLLFADVWGNPTGKDIRDGSLGYNKKVKLREKGGEQDA